MINKQKTKFQTGSIRAKCQNLNTPTDRAIQIKQIQFQTREREKYINKDRHYHMDVETIKIQHNELKEKKISQTTVNHRILYQICHEINYNSLI